MYVDTKTTKRVDVLSISLFLVIDENMMMPKSDVFVLIRNEGLGTKGLAWTREMNIGA
jgi:hypothetical protein